MFCWGFLPIKYSILIQYHENEGTEGLYLMLNVHLYGVEKLAVGESLRVGCFLKNTCRTNKVQYLFALTTYHNYVFDPHHSYPHSHYHHHRSMLLGYICHHHI